MSFVAAAALAVNNPDYYYDNNPKIREHCQAAKKPAEHLRNNKNAGSSTSVASVPISFGAAENKRGYQEK
jgi:hypothetical protein